MSVKESHSLDWLFVLGVGAGIGMLADIYFKAQATPECTLENATQDTICATVPDGHIHTNICQNGHWIPTGETCPECVAGDQITLLCPDGSTILTTICENGRWKPTGLTILDCPFPAPMVWPSVANPKVYKVAFVTDDPANIPQLDNYKSQLAIDWSAFTKGLSVMDTTYPTVVMGLTTNDLTDIASFYDGYPDDFHFVILCGTGSWSHYMGMKNTDHGIGLPIGDSNPIWTGSTKLEGIVRAVDSQWSRYLFAHEISHRWLAYWNYMENGVLMNDNIMPYSAFTPCLCHYSTQVQTDAMSPNYQPLIRNGIIPGSFGWRDNGDGTWTFVETGWNHTDFNLDLYLMGLIPKEQVNPVHLIVRTGDAGGPQCCQIDSIIYGYEKLITVDQIEAAEGPRWSPPAPIGAVPGSVRPSNDFPYVVE